jgi:short-subunit dehydrogenase
MTSAAGVALVTGASKGIGPYIARSLAAAGYRLVLTGRSSAELETLAGELKAKGKTVLTAPADLTQPEDLAALVKTAEHEAGGVDILVNNAGGDPQREFDAMSWSENEAILNLNLIAPMRLTHLLLPGMLSRGSGHIVNISSIAGRVGFPYTEAYAAAKDGLIGFTRILRNDYRSRGISASVIVLGAIRDAGQGQRTADELGLKMPAMGTSPAKVVGKAVLAAIQRDRAEIVVLPGPGRLIKALMDLFPSMGPAMNRAAGADATTRSVIEHRKHSVKGA